MSRCDTAEAERSSRRMKRCASAMARAKRGKSYWDPDTSPVPWVLVAKIVDFTGKNVVLTWIKPATTTANGRKTQRTLRKINVFLTSKKRGFQAAKRSMLAAKMADLAFKTRCHSFLGGRDWITEYGYRSIPIDTFLVGWTSIYQLFWGSLGTRVLTHPHMIASKQKGINTILAIMFLLGCPSIYLSR